MIDSFELALVLWCTLSHCRSMFLPYRFYLDDTYQKKRFYLDDAQPKAEIFHTKMVYLFLF